MVLDKTYPDSYNQGMTLKAYVHQCCRCDHEWISKQEHPKICPHCKSAYWDIPRKHPKRQRKMAAQEKPGEEISFNPVVGIRKELGMDQADE